MATPAEVGRIFDRRIRSLLRDYSELLLAVHQKRRQASLEAMLSEQTVMSLAVYWESFLHDLMIAHIARRPKPCLEGYEERINRSIAEKFPGASRWVEVEFPDTLSSAQVEHLLDPKGWNIVSSSAVQLRDQANRYLDAADARKFSLNADDAAFFDYLIAMRNYLGHRSDGGRQTLLHAVNAITPNSGNAELHGPFQQIGAYLKQRTQVGTRVNSIGARVMAIAAALST
jgi:hypothetical protein